MATFGQGINPQLGAIDYSPILRGSLAGAEMAAKGSQMIGQGLASLGEDAGKAVQKYYYNKDTKEMLGGVTDKIAGILDTDPYIANRLGLRKDPKTNTWDKKGIAIAVTTIGGGDVRKGVAMTSGFLSDRAAQLVENSAFTNATAPGVYMPGRQAAAYASLGGNNPMEFSKFLQNQELIGSQIGKNERDKQIPTGKIMTAEELKKIGPQYNFKSTPLQDGTFFVTNISPFPPASNMSIDARTGAKNENIAYEKLFTTRTDKINPIIDNQETLAVLKEILAKTGKDGMLTGAFAKLETATKSALNATGLTNFEDVAQTQAYIGASGRLVAQVVTAFGSGAGISNEERRYAENIAAGNVTFDRAALNKLINLYEKGSAAQIRSYNADVKSAFGDKPTEFSYTSLYLTPERISGKLSADAEAMLK